MFQRLAVLFLILPALSCLHASPWQEQLEEYARTPRFVVRAWGQSEGAPSNRINYVIQSADGYLWLATYEGLVRFDGKNAVVFTEKDHPALVGGVFTVMESEPGTIWTVSTAGHLIRLRDGTFTVWPPSHAPPAEHLEKLVTDPQGRIVFPGNRAFLTIDEHDQLARYPMPGIDHLRPSVFAFDAQGRFWLAGADGGLWSWQDQVTRQYDLVAMGSPSDRVNAIRPMADGSVWLGIDGRLVRLLPGDNALEVVPEEIYYAPNRIVRFSAGQEEPLLAGTISTPLFHIHNGDIRSLSISEDDTEIVNSITPLRDGGFAIAAYSKGLLILQPSKALSFGHLQNLSGVFVNAIQPSPDGDMLIATQRGILRFNGRDFTPFQLAPEQPFGHYVVDLFIDSRGWTWIGTIGEGIFAQTDTGWITLNRSDGLRSASIRAFAEDSVGNIWIATADGIHRWDPASRRLSAAIGENQGMRSSYVLSLFADERDNLWAGTIRGGLVRIRDKEAVPVVDHDGRIDAADSRTVFAMAKDRAGRIWGGMTGGVFCISGEEVRFLDLYREMDLSAVFHVVDDLQSSFWLSTSRGLFQVPYQDLIDRVEGRSEALPHVRLLNHWDGLPGDSIRPNSRIYRDDRQRIWFPAEQGFFILDPAQLGYPDAIGEVFVDAIEGDGVRVSRGMSLREARKTLPAGTQRLRFEFSTPVYDAPDWIRYEFRLKGFDRVWRETKIPWVEYTNLRPGTYQFEVAAINRQGLRSPIADNFTVTLLPLFYQTYWFYLLLGITLAASGFAIFQWRIRVLRERQAELEALVASRTREIEVSKRRLAQSNSDLQKANAEKNEFLGIAAHDLKNPLAAIESLASLLADEHTARGIYDLQEYTNDIVQSAQNMSSLIIDLLDVNRIERGETVVNLQPVDAITAFESITGHYAISLTNKHISLIPAYDVPPGTCVLADPSLLRQILDNLVSNAIKYSPPYKRVWLQIDQNGETVRFSVRDEGPGISATDQARLFTKFTRLSAQPTGGESSTGLGLSIAKRLVEMLQGRIGCYSQLGAGATFWIELPISASSAPRT